MELSGRRALIGGGSQGIGRACAAELARLGAEIVLMARDESALKKAVADFPADGGRTHRFLVVDTSRPDAMRTRVAEHIAAHGSMQILINNTGGPSHGAIVEATGEQFVAAITNHVLCNQALVQTLLPGMKASKYGRVVNIISTSVIAPIKGLGVSNTTRGAVANWGRTMAGELAPLGITVNNVLPGYTGTARLESLFAARAEKAGKSIDDIRREVIGAIPMARLASPEEIAAVVGFLASPRASYVTGVNLPVDGGRTAVQ